MPERDSVPDHSSSASPTSDRTGSRTREIAVDLFGFAGWVLLTVLVVTAVWPLNVPLLVLAYRVSLGGQKPSFESGEIWWRSFLGALGLAGMSLLCWFVALVLMVGAELTDYRGAIHLVLLLVYMPSAIAFLFWSFAYDDLFGPVAVFALYILIPGLPLIAVCWLFRWLDPLYNGVLLFGWFKYLFPGVVP